MVPLCRTSPCHLYINTSFPHQFFLQQLTMTKYQHPNEDYFSTQRFPRKRTNANAQPYSGKNNPGDNDDTLDLESKVLTLYSNNFTNLDISDCLHISTNRVQHILDNCYEDPAPKKRRKSTRKKDNQVQHRLNVDRLDAVYILSRNGLSPWSISHLLQISHKKTKHHIVSYRRGDRELHQRNSISTPYDSKNPFPVQRNANPSIMPSIYATPSPSSNSTPF